MSILTLDFFIFTFIVLVLYYIAPGKYRFMVLFLASLYFYLDKTPWYQQVAFAVFLIFNYLASLYLSPENKHRKLIFRLIICFDIFVFVFILFLPWILKPLYILVLKMIYFFYFFLII